MATSPFATYANLTVCFQVPSGAEEADGLVVEPVVVTAWAKRYRPAQAQPLQDGEMARLLYRGYWVTPFQKPQGILAEQTGKGYVWRTVPGRFRLPLAGFSSVAEYNAFIEANRDRIVAEGDFILADTPPGPFGVEEKTGDPFEGELVTRTAWQDTV